MFLIVFISFFSLFKSEPLEIVRTEPTDRIHEALAKYSSVQFSYNPGSGQLFLTGHVLTGVDYQEMMFRIDQIDFVQGIDNTVVIDELLTKTMNDILGNNPAWRTASVGSPEAGKFVVSGYVQTSAQVAALNEYLTVNFPYLDRLQNNVAVVETLNTEIQSMLASQGFGGVSFELVGGRLILMGGYNKAMQTGYDKLLKTFNRLPGITRVQNLAVAGTPENSGIDISQQYQISGSALHDGERYSVILNGKIYTAGDTIDAMKITAIGQKTILLEKDGLKYKINYR
jgi:type III secretion system YscD/HrpQ family protein